MAFMNQEMKKQIAAVIKPLLKQYGMKGSLAVRNHSTIVLNLVSGPIDFDTDRPQVNIFWIDQHYTGVAREFLEKAVKALKCADWYDRSDAMTDYFDTAYYVDINVGQWNKPYVCTKSGNTVYRVPNELHTFA